MGRRRKEDGPPFQQWPYQQKLKMLLRLRRDRVLGTVFKDPLGNKLSVSVTQDDCPRPGCPMVLPHLHSIIG